MQKNKKSAEKSQKKSWFQGIKSEFRKIVWTDKKALMKQTVAVVAVTIILSVMITIMDAVILEGINLLMK